VIGGVHLVISEAHAGPGTPSSPSCPWPTGSVAASACDVTSSASCARSTTPTTTPGYAGFRVPHWKRIWLTIRTLHGPLSRRTPPARTRWPSLSSW